MRKRCGGVLSSSSLNVSQTQILEPHDERTDERAKKNIIRRKEKEWSEYYYEFLHGNSIVYITWKSISNFACLERSFRRRSSWLF